MSTQDDRKFEEDPVYTLDDQELPSYDMRNDEELWDDDIPENLDITFEGDVHHHHDTHASSSQKKGRSRSSSRKGSGGRKKDQTYVDRNGVVHSRQPADTIRHHHRRVRRWKKTLIVIGLVLALLVVGIFAAWRILDAVGRTRLYQEGNAVPTLAEADVEQEELTEEEAEVWQSDWIRYNGTVYEYNSDILTFLVMGIDHSSEVSMSDNALQGGQADALFLLIMDPTQMEIKLLAINRATMTEIDVYDEDDNYLYSGIGQICLQHGYGNGMEESCERQVEVVSNLLYDLTINGYASINMGAIPLINNSIGGVTLEALESVPTSSLSRSGVYYSSSDTIRDLVEGQTYTLSGFEAYAYTKYRSTLVEDSASGRLLRQKQYLQTFLSDMKSAAAEDITVVVDLYNALVPYMVTDLDLSEVTYLASNISGYTMDFSDGIYELEGETITGEAGSSSGFDEFYVDDEALYELMLELFYTEVEI